MWTHDVRQALRIFRREPAFALAAVVTLTLGIGANTALFAIVEAALLRPLPFERADELVVLRYRDLTTGLTKPDINLGDFVDLRQRQRSLESLAAYGGYQSTLYGQGDAALHRGRRRHARRTRRAARPCRPRSLAAGRRCEAGRASGGDGERRAVADGARLRPERHRAHHSAWRRAHRGDRRAACRLPLPDAAEDRRHRHARAARRGALAQEIRVALRDRPPEARARRSTPPAPS